MMRFLLVFSIIVLLFSCKKDEPDDKLPFNPTPYDLVVPDGFPDMPIPEENPMTDEGVSLGRKLYYDPILSGDSTMSCATCHDAAFAFTDRGKQFSQGIDGSIGNRNAPAVINVGWMPQLFWDGRVSGIEEQALKPVSNPIEMKLNWVDAERRLNNHPKYPDLFYAAFGSEKIDSSLVVKAIAQFERTIISSNSRWDKYLRGEVSLTQKEAQGFEIFFTEKGDCFHCHSTILFTDNKFRNNGLDSIFEDKGLFNFSGLEEDMGKFKTPTLRNLAFTAPYMHDGRFNTIEEVINFYSDSIVWSPTIDPLMKKVGQGGLHLNQEEKLSLLAFINALTDSTFVNNPDFSKP